MKIGVFLCIDDIFAIENENMNGVHFLFSNMELFAIIEVQDLDRKDEFLLEENTIDVLYFSDFLGRESSTM